MALKIDFFPELGIIQTEMNKIFERFLSLASQGELTKPAWVPLADCYEIEQKLIFKIEIPSVIKESLKLEIRSGYLYIEGLKKNTEDCAKTKYLLMERCFGKFNRFIPINVTVDNHSACAVVKDGMIILTFDKLKERRNRAVEIEIKFEEQE